MDDRLPTRLWVHAGLRASFANGVPAMVRRHGEDDRGAVLIKLNRLDSHCQVLIQSRDQQGRPIWFAALGEAPVPDSDGEAYIARAVLRDPDLWVIEIEDPEGRNPFAF